MKRSEINTAIKIALELLKKYHIALPPFAHWPPEAWPDLGSEYDRIRLNSMGWDVTDLGMSDFDRLGAVHFTVRNGNWKNPSLGIPYCEKLIVLKPSQRTPLHMHRLKTEDIINRAGGPLVMVLYNSLSDGEVDKVKPFTVFSDGIQRTVPPGGIIELQPGESVTLTSGIYHKFWADKKGDGVICGEVSMVNDDHTDNYFAEPSERFSPIEEDEPPFRLLCNEYSKVCP